jgi:GTPase SAR1 family protein
MIMVGPDGVGKTTLLATMYHELLRLNNSSGFEFAASEDTHYDLQEAYKKLTTILRQPTFTPTGPLLKGTAGIIERQLNILFKGKKELDLVFCDIAGGLIRADKNHPDWQDFNQRLEQAVVIIHVIDGSALIEGDELVSLKKNEPLQIYELLLSTLMDSQKDHLLLFVITKCETWLKSQTERNKLERRFEKHYEMLIQLIEKLDNVAGVLIPVKTLGCVEFTRIENKNNEKEMIFVRKPNLRFKPEKIEQPLRYAIAFALHEHNQNRGNWNKLMRWLWNEEVAFQQALTEFAEARSRNFRIYGNSSLIEVTK